MKLHYLVFFSGKHFIVDRWCKRPIAVTKTFSWEFLVLAGDHMPFFVLE
jgi:hypothetical protein